MSARRDRLRADAASTGPSPLTWLTIAAIAAFAGLAGWWAYGVVGEPEPAAFFVASRADPAPALAEDTGTQAGADPAPTTEDSAPVGPGRGNAQRVDAGWASRTSSATGIPLRALRGYAGAELAMAAEAPGCGIRWNMLAALGYIESAHGTHGGSTIGEDGVSRPGIFGIDLTGDSSARITDTDGGEWDGKETVDRAVGPMQFIPATWESWGADGDGDGVRDPQNIDDAALAAARYVCHYGDLSTPEAWRSAIFAYNHLDSYVAAVTQVANRYAGGAVR